MGVQKGSVFHFKRGDIDFPFYIPQFFHGLMENLEHYNKKLLFKGLIKVLLVQVFLHCVHFQLLCMCYHPYKDFHLDSQKC